MSTGVREETEKHLHFDSEGRSERLYYNTRSSPGTIVLAAGKVDEACIPERGTRETVSGHPCGCRCGPERRSDSIPIIKVRIDVLPAGDATLSRKAVDAPLARADDIYALSPAGKTAVRAELTQTKKRLTARGVLACA